MGVMSPPSVATATEMSTLEADWATSPWLMALTFGERCDNKTWTNKRASYICDHCNYRCIQVRMCTIASRPSTAPNSAWETFWGVTEHPVTNVHANKLNAHKHTINQNKSVSKLSRNSFLHPQHTLIQLLIVFSLICLLICPSKPEALKRDQ